MVNIEEFLKQREKEGLLRFLRHIAWRRDSRICIDNKEYIDFSSNDYLGLSNHPKLKEAAKKAIDTFGSGSCASRLMTGSLELHHRLEEAVAKFKNKEAALIFNSGYQANIGIISTLFSKGDVIFSDRLNHASINDAIILSQARFFRFQHSDTGHLQILLEKERDKFNHALIVTESVFSMDGDRAPLKELVRLKEKYNCALMVDEAHATGIFGKTGAGLIAEEGLEEKVDLIMGTFSKALGSFGAYLASSKKIVNYLINTCHAFIYSTALPPSVIAANLASIELIEDEPQRRKILLANAQYFRDRLKESALEVKGASQIVPLVISDNLKALKFAQALQEKGFWVLPMRPPTVPKGQARLRFSLTFQHTKETLQKLSDEILRIRI